ncbi:MAG: hypothetical protein ACK2T4_13175 [Candidatus Promineifilaceae bacterium]
MPVRIPGFKWLVLFWAITAVLWSLLEGDPQRVLFFGFLTTLLGLAYLFQRFMIGRTFSVTGGLFIMALWGLALGAGTVLMTLFLMAVKTGLHAHGPEFSLAQIGGVWQHLPLWSLAGALAGLGIGLLLVARTKRGPRP